MTSKARSIRSKRILVLTIIAIIAAMSALIVSVPPFANALVKDKISKILVGSYGFSEVKDIKVDSHFTGLLTGIVDHIRIDSENVMIKGIDAKALEIKLDNVHFDIVAAILDRKAKIQEIDQGWARIEISEVTLNRYISDNYKNSDSAKVSLPGDGIEVIKNLPLIGSATVKFQPSIRENQLVLRPVEVSFPGNEKMPGFINDLLLKDNVMLDLPIKKMPFNMNVRHIKALKGRIELIADNEI